MTDFVRGQFDVDRPDEVNLVVKNPFGDQTPQTSTWNAYTPAAPRWIGVQFSGRL